MTKIDALGNILEALYPYKLFIEDDSAKHSNHYNTSENDEFPSHVRIVIVSGQFSELSNIARQRLVNKVLKPAFEHGLHGASITTHTVSEFKEKMEVRNKNVALAN